MAARSPQGQQDRVFRFENVVIFKDEDSQLGVGSYGAVYKAKCDQLPCAAKILHPALFQTNDPGSGRILERFEQECGFLSSIRHPNIVQYLGLCRDRDSGLPVLLMEILDSSLTKFLETSNKPLLYHVQVDLCFDIVLAIAYLHSNGIIHRDLSGNNVLIVAGSRAKVTDFGMSKLVDASSRITRRTLTHCPGTEVYMPPEALMEPPVYTKKLDCFSFGALVIQTVTRLYPNPGPRTRQIPFASSPTGRIEMPVIDTERRKSQIDKIDPTHPLLPVATECLKYNQEDRPSAQQLCEQLATLKEAPQYRESLSARDSDINDLKRQLQQLRVEQPLAKVGSKMAEKSRIKLTWRDGGKAPEEMYFGSCTVDGDVAYFVNSLADNAYAHNATTGKWDPLPKCPYRHFTLVVVNGLLTAVGGYNSSSGEYMNKLFSLVGEGRGRKWVEQLPRMPTKRYTTVAVCSGRILVVAGGTIGGDVLIKTVELLDIDGQQWFIASELPRPLGQASVTVCGDNLYLVGGFGVNDDDDPSKLVLTCSLSALVKSARPAPLGGRSEKAFSQTELVWREIASLPVDRSTCASLNGQLVAVGGDDSDEKPTNSVYAYDPTTNRWDVISTMPTARCLCLVVVLPGNKLLAVGGFTSSTDKTDKVEVATF